MKIIRKQSIIFVLAIVLVSYLSIFWGFFQQDEWLSFAYRTVAFDGGLIAVLKDSFAPSVGHFQPFNSLVISILFYLFKTSYFSYAIVSLVLHLTNVLLVYKLAKNFFKEEKAGLFIALIFGVTASIYQATSWVLADLAVHLSTLFALLSMNSLVDFLKTSSKSDFSKLIIFLVISILFKEISLSLFVFFVIALHFSKKVKNKGNYILKLTVIFVIYCLIRISMIFIPTSYTRDKLVTESQNTQVMIYNILSLPAKGLVQSVFPPRLLVKEAYLVAQLIPENIRGPVNTPSNDVFVQKKVLESINLINFLLIIMLCVIVLRESKDLRVKFAILGGLIFVFLGSPIFALSPERTGRIFIIDSRNLYLLAVGSSFVVYSILYSLFEKRKYLYRIVFLLVVLLNIYGLNKDLTEISQSGIVRKKILNEVYTRHPNIPGKAIFYIESDSSYYGLPEDEKILPFQSGLGQTLVVWYGRSENLPNDFYGGRFLWEITDQGYKEFEGRGFGYFRDFDLLKSTLREYNLPIGSVIAFRWISKEGRIVDTTEEIREALNNEKINK